MFYKTLPCSLNLLSSIAFCQILNSVREMDVSTFFLMILGYNALSIWIKKNKKIKGFKKQNANAFLFLTEMHYTPSKFS